MVCGVCRSASLCAIVFALLLSVASPWAVADAPSAGHVELHVWGLNMGTPRTGWLAVVRAFEERHPGVKVVVGPSDRGSDLQKLLCGVIGNSPPDVFKREANLFGDIASRDILMPLDRFIEQDRDRPDGLRPEDYPAGIWDSGKGPDGAMYSIPEGTNALFLAYNKDVFREAGLDPERPPATWAEWIETARMLTVKDPGNRIRRLGNMIHAPYKEDDLVFYIAQLGGDILSEDGRTSLLDQPEALTALTFLRDMVEAAGGRKAYDDFAQTQEGLGAWPIGAGTVAMSVEGHWVLYDLLRRGMDVDIGMAPVPVPEGREPVTTSARHGVYFIPANARQPDEAWSFIRFASGPEGRMIYFDALAEEQARTVGEEAAEIEEDARKAEQAGDTQRASELRDRARRMLDQRGQMYPGFESNLRSQRAIQAKYAPRHPVAGREYAACAEMIASLEFVPVPNSPVYALISDECRRAVDRVLYGERTPGAALADAHRRVQDQLDRHFRREDLPVFSWFWMWGATTLLLLAAGAVLWWRTRDQRAATAIQRYENRMGMVFVSPWAVGFVVFVAGPMVFSLAMSFCDYDVLHPPRYVGLDNYRFLLTSDPLFYKSLANTLFMVLAIPVTMSMSLAIALLLNSEIRGMAVYRTVFYLPAVTPAIAAAVLWYALLNPDGLVNGGLRAVGFAHPPSWLGDAAWSKPAIVLMQLWGAGGGMLLWLAGLQGIPKTYYEAAAIDGAGPVRRFWSITVPMLTPYMLFAFVTGIIGVFQIFAQALVLTRGGPADSTLFYVYYLFNNAFRYFRMGYASAMAWVLFVIILMVTMLQLRASKKWVHYE
jgi:ABC-type sugar transport system permease subunit/ABC-type glycerol-3-phosphate transport system substrate-binding protein